MVRVPWRPALTFGAHWSLAYRHHYQNITLYWRSRLQNNRSILTFQLFLINLVQNLEHRRSNKIYENAYKKTFPTSDIGASKLNLRFLNCVMPRSTFKGGFFEVHWEHFYNVSTGFHKVFASQSLEPCSMIAEHQNRPCGCDIERNFISIVEEN